MTSTLNPFLFSISMVKLTNAPGSASFGEAVLDTAMSSGTPVNITAASSKPNTDSPVSFPSP
jgi:hypothetical protein